jgi:hypothetical protein
LNTVMQLADRLSRHPLLAMRVRFLMRDLIDLRNNRWVLTGAAASIERVAVTKTRDEVRKIIAAEEAKPAGTMASNRPGHTPMTSPRPGGAGPGTVIKGRFTGSGAVGAAPSSKGPASFGPRQGAPAGAAAQGAPAAGEWQTVGAGGKVVAAAAAAAAPAAADAAPAADAKAAAVVTGVVLEGDALRKRFNGIAEEWLVSKDEAELVRSFTEISATPGVGSAFARFAISRAPQEKQPWRDGVAAALATLVGGGHVSGANVAEAFFQFVPEYIEAVSDVPKMAEYEATVRSLCGGAAVRGLCSQLMN